MAKQALHGVRLLVGLPAVQDLLFPAKDLLGGAKMRSRGGLGKGAVAMIEAGPGTWCLRGVLGALVVRRVITFQQPIVAVCPCINLMQAASLSATRTAITAPEVFEMQDKDPRTLRIAGESVRRLWVPARMRQNLTNLLCQPPHDLTIPRRVSSDHH